MSADQMISPEEARDLVLEHVSLMPVEAIPVLDAIGRVCARPVKSDMDVAPFAHSAMDGFCMRASQLAHASTDNLVSLKVIAEVAAGDVYDGPISDDECVRIMTGAELPEAADSVVKYEVVDIVSGDGKAGSVVAFSSPIEVGNNVRAAGEEAKAGEEILSPGEIVTDAGVGYLVSCGALEIDTYKRPEVAIIATGSELVPPTEKPGPGHIRESNSYAIAACVKSCGAEPHILPICEDVYEKLQEAVKEAASKFDFVITTGGAANGDYDFIKQVVASNGKLCMTLVNMRPGKAQTFGIVDGTPVFGLPGNPAAAFCGFQMLIRPALRKMMGYSNFDLHMVQAHLTQDVRKRDPRRIFMRSTMVKQDDGTYEVTPAKNQSSGLFGTIQKTNCLAIMPEGLDSKSKGDLVDCILLDIPEDSAI